MGRELEQQDKNTRYTDEQRRIAMEIMIGFYNPKSGKPNFVKSLEALEKEQAENFTAGFPTKESLSKWWHDTPQEQRAEIMFEKSNQLKHECFGLIEDIVKKARKGLKDIESENISDITKLVDSGSKLIKELKDINFGDIATPMPHPDKLEDSDKIEKIPIPQTAEEIIDVDQLYKGMDRTKEIDPKKFIKKPDGLYKREKDITGKEVFVKATDEEVEAYETYLATKS